jgi:hypothetical protein
MINLGSRYQSEPVLPLLDGRSNRVRPTVMRSNDNVGATSPYLTQWTSSSRLDRMSAGITNGPTNWWLIMDQNTDIIDPMSIVAGTQVRVFV